jgi:hypothetical protein
LQHAFPLNVSIVPSSVITVATDGERLTCGGSSLGELVHLGNFEFIIDYFDGVSLSPRRGDSGVAFIGSTHSGTPSPRRAMIGDSTEEFNTTSDGEGGDRHPLSQEALHGGFDCPRHNHIVTGEHSDHSGYGNNSTMAGGAAAEHQPPFRGTLAYYNSILSYYSQDINMTLAKTHHITGN